MTNFWQDPAVWTLAVGVPVATTVVFRQRGTIRALRHKKQVLEGALSELQSRYDSVESTLGELRGSYDEVVRRAKEEAENATKTVLKSAMQTIQGLAAEQQQVISDLQKKYGDSAVLQDLLNVDHMNAQFKRRAQTITVLCDGWLGRQREAASVYDVIRGAQGGIRHYQRVDVLSQVDFAVASLAVEPVVLAVAELLDNATSYSAPEAMVEINVRTVPKGICIVIDDAGVGMSEEEKTNASALLSGTDPVSVAELGNPPKFGFAVIGTLCARYGFTVTIDATSPYGGVRAVVLVPENLLTTAPAPKILTSTASADTGSNGSEPGPAGTTSDGLPKRRRRRAMAVVRDGDPASHPPPTGQSNEERAAVMGAFQRGTVNGRSAVAPATEHKPSSADAYKGPDAP